MKIGILEDDPALCGLLREMLEYAGHVPVFYHNGWDFLLDVCENERTLREGVCDAVLVDLALPYLSGIEIMQALETVYPSLPIIVISASTLEYLDNIKHRYPHVRILRKPFRLSELLHNLSAAVAS